jgi:alpha-tubulin suppressor-like RCC1 family protein
VAAGEFHTCALLADGSTWCWGSNVESQAGTGVPDNDPHPVPAAVPGLGDRVVDLASGAEHLCALLAGGPVLCWGYDYYSQCAVPPDPVLPYVTVPTAVAGIGGDVAAVAAGNNHGCVVLASGGVRCWGANETAQGGARDPGLPATAPADVPGLDERVVDLAAGRGHTCALTVSGRVRCWGANECGQVGNGSFSACMTYGDTPVYDPSEVDGLGPGVRAIAAGEDFTCAITADGRVRCWGANYYGQVGDATGGEGAPESVPLPVDVVGIEGAVGVEGGLWHACAVLDDGSARCWGADDWGQLGDGGEIGVGRYSNVPVEVLGFGD